MEQDVPESHTNDFTGVRVDAFHGVLEGACLPESQRFAGMHVAEFLGDAAGEEDFQHQRPEQVIAEGGEVDVVYLFDVGDEGWEDDEAHVARMQAGKICKNW